LRLKIISATADVIVIKDRINIKAYVLVERGSAIFIP
jgi:hypothetical protein